MTRKEAIALAANKSTPRWQRSFAAWVIANVKGDEPTEAELEEMRQIQLAAIRKKRGG